MADKPILFSGPMVRAILSGSKTVTRRVLFCGDLDRPFQMGDGSWHVTDSQGGHMSPLAVRYVKGDRLWVREALERGATFIMDGEETKAVVYSADGSMHDDANWVWKRDTLPSIHCPRGLSRITLEVTDVKVERLQDISEADAIAEGVDRRDDGKGYSWPGSCHNSFPATARIAFFMLWDSINAARPGCSWDDNPWVAAYTFRRIKP